MMSMLSTGHRPVKAKQCSGLTADILTGVAVSAMLVQMRSHEMAISAWLLRSQGFWDPSNQAYMRVKTWVECITAV